MNNYISIEITEFDKKMSGYLMLFNYRLCNYCVKAEPTAMLPVSVLLGGKEYNFEDVAEATKPDDYTFDVLPKNQNNLKAIVDGVFDMHPEFKMEIKTVKTDSGEELRHVIYTMPEVDKDRRDLLNETSKTFHRECIANFDTCYTKQQATLAEMIIQLKMPANEVDEAKSGFKNIYNEAKEQADKMLMAKLSEIEEGYLRHMTTKKGAPNSEDTDFSKSMRLDQIY